MDSMDGNCIEPPNSYGEPEYESGDIDCDWDDDDKNDGFLGESDRGWLDLNDDSNASAADLHEKIIKACVQGVGENLTDHTWVGSQSGVASSTFKVIQNNCIDETVIVPVFDTVCENTNNPEADCPAHIAEEEYITRVGASNYYHIVGFASFTITCVHADGGDKGDWIEFGDGHKEKGSICEGRNKLQEENPAMFSGVTPLTIEGYLTAEISPEVGGSGGVDSGTYTIYLIE
jgi:hypothetical protein